MKFLPHAYIFTTIALSICLSCRPAFAQWSNNPNVNNAICSVPSESPAIASDGAGGVFITWQDDRSGITIYAQRVSAAGNILWTSNGIPIDSLFVDAQYAPVITSDGAGGAIIAWLDDPGDSSGYAYLYAQRINSSGSMQWTSKGVQVDTTQASIQSLPTIASDGNGGAVLAWQRVSSKGIMDVCAQRINASGAIQWQKNGIVVDTGLGNLSERPIIINDGAQGAIVAWTRYRETDSPASIRIYAQHIAAAGTVLWTTNGIPVCPAPPAIYAQMLPAMISDGTGGAIVAWADGRIDPASEFAQHIGANGVIQWGSGAPIDTVHYGGKGIPAMVSDGSGGALITWMRSRNGGSDVTNPYAQWISGDGNQHWTANGVMLDTSTIDIYFPLIVSDGSGGAIISWAQSDGNIRAQHINNSGATQWISGGVSICSVARIKTSIAMSGDGAGDAILAWQDWRNLLTIYSTDIYGQRINSLGALATGVSHNALLPATTVLQQNYPNPFNPSTTISFTLPSRSFVTLKVFDIIGREITTIVSEEIPAGSYSRQWNAVNVSSGIYFYRLQAGTFTQTKKMLVLK
jgi:Secretion system C-terminal sorting domain